MAAYQQQQQQQKEVGNDKEDTLTNSRLLIKVDPALILSIRKCYLGQVATTNKSRKEKLTSKRRRFALGDAASTQKVNDKGITNKRTRNHDHSHNQQRRHAKKTFPKQLL